MTPKQILTSASQNWETPKKIFAYAELCVRGFDVDVAASESNALCPHFWTKEDDGLAQDWSNKKIWCNPPYKKGQHRWIQKAIKTHNCVSVFLIPARTDTKLWQDMIFPKAAVIIFLRGRLKFLVNGFEKGPSTFPSALVAFDTQRDAHSEYAMRTFKRTAGHHGYAISNLSH